MELAGIISYTEPTMVSFAVVLRFRLWLGMFCSLEKMNKPHFATNKTLDEMSSSLT